MDIKFTTSKLNAYWNAVKDCDAKSVSRLARNIENGSLTLEQGGRLEDREIEQLSPEDQAKYRLQNSSARAMLLQSLSEELEGLKLTGSALDFAEQYLAGLRIKLDGPGKHGDPVFTNGSALDGRDVKQILSHFETVKSQAEGLKGEFSSWNIGDYDPDNPGELEWQSVVRGHNDAVRPNGRQTDLLVYGKCAALVKAMGITPEQSDQIDLTDFAQKPDGTITCKARRDGAVVDELTLDADGVLTAKSQEAEFAALANEMANDYSASVGSLKNPASAFDAADVKAVREFLRFFALTPMRYDKPYQSQLPRSVVLNLLPDALAKIHDLRQKGKLKGETVSLSTWWTSLGLKPGFPGGKDNGKLSAAFYDAVEEKMIDDFVKAKGWDRLENDFSVQELKAWMKDAGDGLPPGGWARKAIVEPFGQFCAATGQAYSQKLRWLTTADRTTMEIKDFYRTQVGRGGACDKTDGFTGTRADGAKVLYRSVDEANLGGRAEHVYHNNDEADKELFAKLLKQGFTSQQLKRVFEIPNADIEWLGSFGTTPNLQGMTLELEASGEDMLLIMRQPVECLVRDRVEGWKGAEMRQPQVFNRTTEDMVIKFSVHPDGSYERAGLAFERAVDRQEPVLVQRSYYSRI